MLVGVMDVSPQGFYHVKTSICWYFIWLCEWLLKVFILCWNTCVVEHGIKACLKTHSCCRSRSWSWVASSLVFSIYVHFWAKRTIPLCSENSFQLGTHFVSLKKVSIFPRYDHFSQIHRYKAWIRIFYIFTEYYFCFISFVYYLFLGCYSFRSVYSLFSAPCAISINKK